MKTKVILSCFLGLLIMLSCEREKEDDDIAPKEDKINILSVNYSQDPLDAIMYDITVEVEYELVSVDSGELSIGYNISAENMYNMDRNSKQLVAKGSGTHTFNTWTMVAFWEDTPFTAYVHLASHPHPSIYRPLTSDKEIIDIPNPYPN